MAASDPEVERVRALAAKRRVGAPASALSPERDVANRLARARLARAREALEDVTADLRRLRGRAGSPVNKSRR